MVAYDYDGALKVGPLTVDAASLVGVYIAVKPLYLWHSGIPQIADLLLVVATVLLAKRIWQSAIWAKNTIRSTVLLFVGLCLFQGVVNVAWSVVLHANLWKSTLFYAFNCMAFVDVLVVAECGVERLKQAMLQGAIVSLAVVIIGLLFDMSHDHFYAQKTGETLYLRSTSFFNHPNQLGFHCLIILMLVLWCSEGVKHRAVIIVPVTVVTLLAIVASASRAAFVGALVMVAAYGSFVAVRIHAG